MSPPSKAPAPAPAPDPLRSLKMFVAGAMAGAISRTATAPVDRTRMLMQTHVGERMTLTQAYKVMASEMKQSNVGVAAFFKGNLANCLKIAPETAIKLTMYDSLKTHVLDWRRQQQQLAYESHVASIQHTSPAYTLTMTPQNVTPPTDTAVSLYAHERLVLGAVSGAVGQLTVYPLEMVRTRIAVAPTGMYEGVSHAIFSVAQREGVGALYRGVGASMLGILPYAGVDLMIFEGLKKRMLTAYDTPPPALNFVSGMVASCVAQFVAYPFALVRTRLQKQGMIEGDTTRYRGIVDCFSQTVRNEGILGLYKGLLPNVLKLAPAAGINWLVFEQAKLSMGIDARS